MLSLKFVCFIYRKKIWLETIKEKRDNFSDQACYWQLAP